jgi:hypothetical protein
MTTPDANFTAARIDAAQSFTGDQTLATGNLVIGTSGKGIDFTATAGAGTSELFADYEEGTWTANITCGISGTITLKSGAAGDLCYYTKIGRVVTINGYLSVDSVASPLGAFQLNGLPFTVLNNNANYGGMAIWANGLAAGATTALQGYTNRGSTMAGIGRFSAGNDAALSSFVQANSDIFFQATYVAA